MKQIIIVIYRILCLIVLSLTITANFLELYIFLPNFNAWNYLSFFTIQSNLLVTAWFLISSIYTIRTLISGKNAPVLLNQSIKTRGALMVYAIVTAIIYWLFLFNTFKNITIAGTITNFILHTITPITLIIDLFLVPSLDQTRIMTPLFWIIYPLLYGIYTFVRGAIVHWYPYWFLDPQKFGSYIQVVVNCIFLALFFYLIGWGIIIVYQLIRRQIHSQHK